MCIIFRLCSSTSTMARLTKKELAQRNAAKAVRNSLAMRKNAKMHLPNATRNPVLPLAHTSESRPEVGTFTNHGSFACYANASMQAFFHVVPVSYIPNDSIMENIFAYHEAKKIQNMDAFRMEIKQGFECDVRQCPADFLSAILATPKYRAMEPYFSLTMEDSRFCTNKTCSYVTISDSHPTHYIGVQVTGECKTVQNLLDVTLENKIINESQCVQCGSPYGTSSSIISNGSCVIVKVHANKKQTEKLPTLISGISDEPITINGKKYTFECMVSHCGKNLTSQDGHYVAWLKKNGQYVYISDNSARLHSTLPTHGYDSENNESPYLIFYKELATSLNNGMIPTEPSGLISNDDIAMTATSKGPIIHTGTVAPDKREISTNKP